MKKITLIIALLLPFIVNAQEEHKTHNEHIEGVEHNEHHEFKKWRVALAMSQSYIPRLDLIEGESTAQFIPTNGVEVQYFFTHKLSAKWINEIEFQNYTVNGADGEYRVRENAYLIALVLGYEIYGHLGVFAGGGYEFEKNEDLWVIRLGAEYAFELPGDWDITPALMYDYKAESHTAYTFSLTIGKKF
ncbi:MAG: hypothetical protein KAG37_08455 [Flavobacteriales bacterium]|nr:hypothetical protein [Flavobacteriales bacterium]